MEYSTRKRGETVWRNAPRWAVIKEQRRRMKEKLPLLSCRGLADNECSESQQLINKLERLRTEARLLIDRPDLNMKQIAELVRLEYE